ncbi:MAG: amidohydrolase family protein [Cyclobacteriaceae bacterium]
MEGRTIFKGRYLWDGIRGNVIPEGAVLIEKGIIRAVGSSNEILTASEAQVFDWPDATLLPGLIDSHTHLSMDGDLENYLDHMSDSIPVLTLRATAMMRKDLMAGVTVCRCLGDKEFLDVACREAVAKGEVAGPRLLVATRGIRAPHGHGFVGYPFKGSAEIRKAIKENIARGADLIKIYITGTLKGTGNLPAYLSREEIRLAIDESHDAGMRVASHCVGGEGLDWALELRLDTLEHAYHITTEQVQRLADSNTLLVLTPGAVLAEDRVRRLPQAIIQGHIDEQDAMFKSMALTVKARIPFAVGTDGMHGDLAEDISLLATLGATNVEALQAATLHGARVCGIEKETGSLEVGKRADIIAVRGNPMVNLHDLRKIIAVINNGDIVHHAANEKLNPENYVYGTR